MNVGEICNREAGTVCASATLNEAASLLSNSYADALVAVASAVQRPTAIGMITYRDLLNALETGRDLERVRVLDVLDRNPLVLNEEENIESAILKLRSRGAKHAAVVGTGGTLRGAVSMDRLLGCRCAGELRAHPAGALAETTYK